METRPREIHIEKEAARAGSTPHVVRYVLLASLALAVFAMSAIWITGALTTADPAEASGAQTASEASQTS